MIIITSGLQSTIMGLSPGTKGHTTVLIQGITEVNGINPPGQHITIGNESVLANANGICFAH